MRQLLILSGKGGTGKTTVAGAFLFLSRAAACADCDVDAPNLHLLLQENAPPDRADYLGMPKARIDPDRCIGCGRCREHCRFDAVSDSPPFQINPAACEGCGVCVAVCPAKAVSMTPSRAGELALYRSADRLFSTARLRMGSGASGKLVAEVKKRMTTAAREAPLAIIDGSPGIGCPVIASLSGTDLVLIVAEPSLSGLSDMERLVRTAEISGTKAAVCLNKCDTHPAKAEEIREFCRVNHLPFVGGIPFDPQVVKAVNRGQSIAEIECPSGAAVREVFRKTLALVFEQTRPKSI